MNTIELIKNFVMTAINVRYEEYKNNQIFSLLMQENKVEIPLMREKEIELIVNGITYVVEIKEKV